MLGALNWEACAEYMTLVDAWDVLGFYVRRGSKCF